MVCFLRTHMFWWLIPSLGYWIRSKLLLGIHLYWTHGCIHIYIYICAYRKQYHEHQFNPYLWERNSWTIKQLTSLSNPYFQKQKPFQNKRIMKNPITSIDSKFTACYRAAVGDAATVWAPSGLGHGLVDGIVPPWRGRKMPGLWWIFRETMGILYWLYLHVRISGEFAVDLWRIDGGLWGLWCLL